MAEKAKGKKEVAPPEKGAPTKAAPKAGEKPAAAPPAEAPAEKPEEERPAAKPKGKKKPKVRKKEKGAYTRYKIEDTGFTRLRPYCERCGLGYFMADHGDRFACGHCGFTRYKRE
jgi:small subunit ribosomal protein S27Ae